MINFKRFISAILSLVMVLFLFRGIPVFAETETTEYIYDNYSVEYKISNEWTGNQSVEVKITNTSDEYILNWAIKYDAKGEVSGLWSAVSVSNEGNTYLIKNAGYNYEIAPDQTVTFGYTLSGDNLSLPESFELCSKRVDTAKEKYEVTLNVSEEWDTGFKGEITVSNISDAPIEAWQLSFDSSFTVSDIWDCRLLGNDDGRYTIASEAWSNPIEPDSSVTIGIVGTKTEGQEVNISNISLSEVVIDDTLPEVQEPVGKMFIVAFGEYVKETETIDILWMSTQTEGTFEIMSSDNNTEYAVIGSVQNVDTYSIHADFVKKYIKVRQTNGNQTVESEPFVVMMTPTGYTVDFIDSDNDGLYDYIEDAVGTNKNLPDTDSDNLSDYEEVYILGTDPLVYDSIVSGTSDGDADPDNDGLSNRYELDNGTNPLYDDTDGDGLKDGEEVNQYGTDPLKSDTDGDNINDGDEIVLSLDPDCSSTDGTPDNERLFEQEIASDSEIMSQINTADNAFEMSIAVSAAGNAENNIFVSESSYSAVIRNDAVLGAIPEISYTEGLSIGEVTLKFEIKDEYTDNVLGTYSDCEEMSGIKRLNIFRYFEDENILLPIETKFDIENNMVYTDVDRVGTYCLIDMEKWFEDFNFEQKNLEITLSNDIDDIGVNFDKIYDKNEKNIIQLMYNPFIESFPGWEYRVWAGIDLIEQRAAKNISWEYGLPVLDDEALDNINSLQNIDYVDVVVFSAIHSKSYKNEMSEGEWITNKFKEMEYLYGNIHFYVYDIDGTIITTETGKEYAETFEDVKDIVSNIKPYSFIGEKTDRALENAFELYKNKDEIHNISLLNEILSLGNFKDNYYRWDSICESRGCLQYGGFKQGCALYEDTEIELNRMMFNNIILSGQNPVIIVVYCYYNPSDKCNYNILTSTGLKALPSDFNSKTDYDDDGLSNNEEINWDSPLIKDKSLKTYDSLPTVQECIDYKSELTYVEDGLKRLQTLPGSAYSQLIANRILPIKSDPLSIDGDGDGSTDDMDIYPLVYDQIPLEFRKMYFEGLISKEKIYNTDDGFYICMDSIESILENMKCDIMDNSVGVYQREYFDDQYFYAVKNSEDYAYSIVKLREIGDLDVHKESATYGVAVPFCEFDMDEFNYCDHNYDCNCDYANQSTIDSLHKVTAGDGECSKTLAYYFSDVKSEGSYLIGELYIQKLIDESFANSNTVELKQKPKFFWEKLLSMPSYRLRTDYFNPPETITINDKSNLSNEERRLLIRYSLGNSSLNSFAAEIQAHAIAAFGGDVYSDMLQMLKNEIKSNPIFKYGLYSVSIDIAELANEELLKHSIKADVSYGEETLSAMTVFLYLEDWSILTTKQIEEHGKTI